MGLVCIAAPERGLAMTIFDKLLRALGFKRLIRIPGVSFENLTDEQAAILIEEFIANVEDKFDSSALYEFRVIPNKDSRIENIRKRVLEIEASCASGDYPDSLRTKSGRAALKNLASELRIGRKSARESR